MANIEVVDNMKIRILEALEQGYKEDADKKWLSLMIVFTLLLELKDRNI